MTKTCPCCGRELPNDAIEAINRIDLSPIERKIMLRFAQSIGEPLGTDALIDAVWWDDIDGGPQNARATISVHIHNLRPKLAEIGMAIDSKPGRRGRRLVWTAERRAIGAAA